MALKSEHARLARTVTDHIAMLCRERLEPTDPALASQIRRRVRAGVSYQDAQLIIGLLRQLPARQETKP